MITVAQTTTRAQTAPTTTTHPDLDHAAGWGREDATDERDQRGSAYFPIGSPAWHAYNEGYAEGCAILAILTGRQRPVFEVSWNSEAA